jgi:hypothetical protein
MKRFWIYLPVLILLPFAAGLFVRAQQQIEPTFALHIEQTHEYEGPAPGILEIRVQYINISGEAQKDGCAVTPWVYKTIVLRDGVQLERIKPKVPPENPPDKNDHRTRIEVRATEQDTCRGSDEAIQPGKSVMFPLGVGFEYNLSQPGTYEVTVTRDMFPCEIDHGPTIKSNTLTIVVPPASGSSSPQQ